MTDIDFASFKDARPEMGAFLDDPVGVMSVPAMRPVERIGSCRRHGRRAMLSLESNTYGSQIYDGDDGVDYTQQACGGNDDGGVCRGCASCQKAPQGCSEDVFDVMNSDAIAAQDEKDTYVDLVGAFSRPINPKGESYECGQADCCQ